MRIPILMYHHTSGKSCDLNVPPGVFRKQVDWLKDRGYAFLSLDEVVSSLARRGRREKTVALTFDDGNEDNLEGAFDYLLGYGIAAGLFVVAGWVGQNGFMSWQTIRFLSEHGITVGSHSLTHRWLPHIEKEEELREEIAASKAKIEDAIGARVDYFSYPVGGVDRRVRELVQEAGYRAACVAGARPDLWEPRDLFLIRRIKMTERDGTTFLPFKISPLAQWWAEIR